MRDDPFYRCIGIIDRFPGVESFIRNISLETQLDVRYIDEPAHIDDLDFVDKVLIYDRFVDLTGYQHHCGSLWARREQDVKSFWHHLQHYLGDNFDKQVPLVFCEDTRHNPLYDD